ncbi:hypothetical protein Nit79A3_1018 [Nitrosomonas sp. Is79A3]|uniref:hypothetical protein n=1 Tax=Nitrosomonas sp. (strain Is79A3) TaxID=261292 RepID=UPI000215C74B
MVQSTITNANPGNIVVPLSAIIDQLKDKLSSAEIEALLSAILSQKKSEVRPGDLITVELINQILNDLINLNLRVAQLESGVSIGQAPIIDQIVPAVQRVGGTLTVIGRNFNTPPEKNIVEIAGFSIERFQSSPDGELVFGIPLIDITGEKLDTKVSVQTEKGFTSKAITLLPRLIIPEGFVSFTEDTANRNLPAIASPGTYDIGFMVNSQTDVDESYVISAGYIDAVGSFTVQQWKDATTLKTATGDAITETPLKLPAFTPVKVVAHVVVPAGATANTTIAKLFIRVRSVNNDAGLSKSSDPLVITVGQKLPFSDPRVDWVNEVPTQPTATNKARRTIDSVTGKEFVEIPFGSVGLMTLRVTFKIAGNFSYEVTMDPASAGAWAPIKPSPLSSTGKQNGENELIGVILKLLATADAQHGEARTLTIKATRTPPAGAPATDTETFTSWTTISIRGYMP